MPAPALDKRSDPSSIENFLMFDDMQGRRKDRHRLVSTVYRNHVCIVPYALQIGGLVEFP